MELVTNEFLVELFLSSYNSFFLFKIYLFDYGGWGWYFCFKHRIMKYPTIELHLFVPVPQVSQESMPG